MSFETQLATDWNRVVESKDLRRAIAREALKKSDMRAAGSAVRESHPPKEGQFGFVGVDKPNRRKDTYRARISLWDCPNGQWIRVSRTGFASPGEAGFWYACMHVAFWGSLSVHADEMTLEDYELLTGKSS